MTDLPPSRPPRASTPAGGIFIALGVIGGIVAGVATGQVTLGMFAGLAIGIAVAALIWWRGR
ncbi:hypothetical protein [Sphingomonas sp.]|uniref:hypothetical protein n=1 Tax=Sphingomonas sp. TaxID=28214 RepID=UPI0031CDF0AB